LGTNNGKGKSDDKGNQKSQFCEGNGGKVENHEGEVEGGRGWQGVAQGAGVNEKYSRDI